MSVRMATPSHRPTYDLCTFMGDRADDERTWPSLIAQVGALVASQWSTYLIREEPVWSRFKSRCVSLNMEDIDASMVATLFFLSSASRRAIETRWPQLGTVNRCMVDLRKG
ncbi:hypothetical protein RRG08_064188 [Elysia crispata]|uniref:Uncharacterized protein n=1 Tax=Elysia crispata TaxID=231223 RepID=A0AAE0YHG6_9GAST|nr:hypothetical protein RRG08_064188 [Elysia crispata]